MSRPRAVVHGLVLALAVGVYLHDLGSPHIPKNGDEYPYTHITRLTAASGTLLPLRSELPGMRNTKPPLLFWQGIVSTRWGRSFGLWNLRYPSVVYTFLTSLLVFLLGRRLAGSTETGLVAALAYLTFFAIYRYGRPFLTNGPEIFWLFAPFFAGAAGTGHCWHWEAYVDANNLWWHFGRFAAAVEGLDPPAENFEPLMVDHPRLRVYVLRGRQTTLAWRRDKQNTWHTELAENIAPGIIDDASIDFGQIASSLGTEVRVYDPWQNNWTEARLEGHKVRLPAFSRSVLVRIAEGR